ncbi:MAG: hypothetical protein R2751_08860 [Bacteroidales bacterium]
MKSKRPYKKPILREIPLDKQTSMILQSPPGDPEIRIPGFPRIRF